MRNKELHKIVSKLPISLEEAKEIIIYDHILNNYIPKRQLKHVDVNLNMNTQKLLAKLAKALKVSEDAIIGHALIKSIEKEGLDK